MSARSSLNARRTSVNATPRTSLDAQTQNAISQRPNRSLRSNWYVFEAVNDNGGPDIGSWRITLQGLTGRQQGNSFSASGSQIEPSTLGQTFAAAIASQASHVHANPFSTAQSQGSQLVRFLREGFLIKSYWKPTLKQHHFQLVPMGNAPRDIQAQANHWRHAQHGRRQH